MAAAMAGYYGWVVLVQGGAGHVRLWAIALLWLVVGLVAGALFGVAGWSWRCARPDRGVLAAGLLAGGLCGEALFLLARGGAGMPILIPELLSGLMLPVLLVRRPHSALAAGTAVASAPGAAMVTGALLAAARAVA